MTLPLGPLGREPSDPASAGMRQLTYIAVTYASTCGAAASFGAETVAIGMIGAMGLAHALIASRHGIKRSQHDRERAQRT